MANFVLLQGAQRVAVVPRTFASRTQPALATIATSRLRAGDPQF